MCIRDRVTPDEPVPNIPGLTPSVPTVTPIDPGKDPPVPYTPETPATVSYTHLLDLPVQYYQLSCKRCV